MPGRKLAVPLLLLACAAAALHNLLGMRTASLQSIWIAVGASAALGFAVWLSRTGTAGAACAGFVCAVALSAGPLRKASIAHSGLPLLLLLLALTTSATRLGRVRKRLLHAEQASARDAAQVLANLSVAACASALPLPWGALAATAALAECAADTLASEIGVLADRRVWLITGGWAPAGTDGGLTFAGTLVAAAAAALIAAAAVPTLHLTATFVALAAVSGFAGSLVDSLLGATLERRDMLRNNAVNWLSTFAAALLALAIATSVHYSS